MILILLGTCTAKIYDLILVEKTKVFSTNIKSYILALEKKQSFFCTVSPFQKGAYPQTASPSPFQKGAYPQTASPFFLKDNNRMQPRYCRFGAKMLIDL